MKKNLLIFSLLIMSFVLFNSDLLCATDLIAGDIAIIGVRTDNPDSFSFVVLKDIEEGTVINFTDSGWIPTEDGTSGSFRANENTFAWTADSDKAFGTVVTLTDPETTGDFFTLKLAEAGDQVIAFQGTSENPTFIYAIQTYSTVWQDAATSAQNSALPTGLVNGTTAVAVGENETTYYNNAWYNGTTPTGDKDDMLDLISKRENWTGSDDPTDYPVNITLPVTFASFMAIQTSENYAELTWVTHSESGVAGYNVLRNDVEDLATSIRVNDNLVTAFNNSTNTTYSFTDTETEMNTTYYYWLESNDFNGDTDLYGPVSIKLSEENDTTELVIPTKTSLKNIYPNPFNPSTTVNFFMDKADKVKLNVYNVKGQLINTITEGNFEEGFHNVTWNGTDLDGNDCASGIYFFRMETKTENQMIKGILLK